MAHGILTSCVRRKRPRRWSGGSRPIHREMAAPSGAGPGCYAGLSHRDALDRAVASEIKDSDARKVTWVPNAPEGKATEISILITTAATTVSGWPGKGSMGTGLVGSVTLANGDTVWAVHMV